MEYCLGGESETDAFPRKSRSLGAFESLLDGCDLSIDEGAVSPGERGLRHLPGAGFDVGRIVSQRIFRQPAPNDGLARADHIFRNRLSARLLEADKFFNRRDDHSWTSVARNQNGFSDSSALDIARTLLEV